MSVQAIRKQIAQAHRAYVAAEKRAKALDMAGEFVAATAAWAEAKQAWQAKQAAWALLASVNY